LFNELVREGSKGSFQRIWAMKYINRAVNRGLLEDIPIFYGWYHPPETRLRTECIRVTCGYVEM
jgi:hypothetical protein